MRVAIVLVLVGLGATGCKRNETPTAPTPNTNVVAYAVVGASDAVGFGSSAPCMPFEDCNGNGYAQIIKRRFQSDGATVTLTNRGLPGAVLSQPLLLLGREIGRGDIVGTFMEQIVPFIPANATHISVFAGGNDANLIAQSVRAGRGSADVRSYIDQQVAQFGTDLNEMVARLRARAPNARIVAMNLPNLAAAPYVRSLTTAERSILQRIVVGLSDRINALTAQTVPVIDLMCEPRIYSAANYSADGFHPSDAGYALMADLLYPALRTGSAPAPSSNCPQRTLLPVF